MILYKVRQIKGKNIFDGRFIKVRRADTRSTRALAKRYKCRGKLRL